MVMVVKSTAWIRSNALLRVCSRLKPRVLWAESDCPVNLCTWRRWFQWLQDCGRDLCLGVLNRIYQNQKSKKLHEIGGENRGTNFWKMCAFFAPRESFE